VKIQATYVTAATQVHNGKCYFLGLSCETGKAVAIHDIESSGTAATGNRIGYENSTGFILPKPGVECSNGLYYTADANACIYWSLG